MTHTGTNQDTYTVDFRAFNRAGELRWLRLISSVEYRDRLPVLVGLALDVTSERQSQLRVRELADKDPLTQLINRRRFCELLREQINHCHLTGSSGALLLLDIDQFKYINDTFGHDAGDQFLQMVSRHLRQALSADDILGRLGGDEFGVLLLGADGQGAIQASRELLAYLRQREFNWRGSCMPFSASVGIALFPEHGSVVGDLLARADSAMYSAKERGRNTYHLFQEEIDVKRMQDKVLWEERIRSALKDNRFQLYFQPIVHLDSGDIIHYECLLRLREGEQIIGPGAFIAIAERFGTIRDVDYWVVRNAIRTQGSTMGGRHPVTLAINLSGRHFSDSPSELLEVIEEATKTFAADPTRIIFEVTETAAVENFEVASEFIHALHHRGYRFALDDFGVGFASFEYLRNIQVVDYVKIDGSFVRQLHQNKVDRFFVSAIAELARSLRVDPIAEFVENRQIVDCLRELNVSLGQGYYFAPPQPTFLPVQRLNLDEIPLAPPAAEGVRSV
ncbi:MAG: putative bifunctional diguanylate cyclase/phosphodiesterase [Candidatus Competibacterales bacterium]